MRERGSGERAIRDGVRLSGRYYEKDIVERIKK